MKLNYLLFLSLFLIASCSSEDDLPFDPVDQPIDLKLKERYVDDELRGEWTYDQEDRVSTATYYVSGGNVFQVHNFEYLSDDEYILTATGSFPYTERHSKISDSQIRLEELSEDGSELRGYFDYSFEADQACGFTEFEQYDENDNILTSSTRNYMGIDCSYETLYYDETGVLSYREVSNLDGMKNAFESALSLAQQMGSLGNVIELSAFDADGNPDPSSSYTAEFSYNDEGYPLTEVRTSGTGDVTSYQYVYF